VAHLYCLGILWPPGSWEWIALFNPFISSTSPLRSSRSLAINFRPRLSFTVVVDLPTVLAKSINHTSPTHSINYTFKMKYQLIALPALAATVAAQDLYVSSSKPNQHRSSTNPIAATPSSACSRLLSPAPSSLRPSPTPPPSAARSPPSSPLARLPPGSPPSPPTSRATSSPPTSPVSPP
jgi:hypothetical protein